MIARTAPQIAGWCFILLLGAPLAAFRQWRECRRLAHQTNLASIRSLSWQRFETLVAEAAAEVGPDRWLGDELAARYAELCPWPGVASALAPLIAAGVKLGVATNCSEALARVAAARVGVRFDAMVTAERAGFYKPDPAPYRLALTELGVAPERCLFVAGSAFDLIGASRVGLAIWWHDRIGMEKPAEAPEPLRHTRGLEGLAEFVLGG